MPPARSPEAFQPARILKFPLEPAPVGEIAEIELNDAPVAFGIDIGDQFRKQRAAVSGFERTSG